MDISSRRFKLGKGSGCGGGGPLDPLIASAALLFHLKDRITAG